MPVSASGLMYEDVSGIIEKIAENKAKQYRKIAYLDAEDIKQEVRIKCFHSLKKYDANRDKADLFVFLSVCADNKLRDIKRNILYKHNNYVCKVCAGNGKKSCNKCKRHERNVHSKISLSMPISLEDNGLESNLYNFCHKLEMVEYIKCHLPSGLHGLFDKFEQLNFDFGLLKPKERASISGVIHDTINKFYKE